jgi:hypothetical protein
MPSPFRRDHLEGQVTRLPTLTENRPDGGILPTDLVTVVTDPTTDPVIRQVPVSAFGSAAINVRSFGAVGDGVTDDTAAIQRAIDAANGADVVVPEGVYRITSAIEPPSGSRVIGVGGAVLDGGNGSYEGIRIDNKTNVQVSGLGVRNLGSYGMLVLQSSNVLLENCTAQNVQQDGLSNEGAFFSRESDTVQFVALRVVGVSNGKAIALRETTDSVVARCVVENASGSPLDTNAGIYTNDSHRCSIIACTVLAASGNALKLSRGSSAIQVIGGSYTKTADDGQNSQVVYLQGTERCILDGCTIRQEVAGSVCIDVNGHTVTDNESRFNIIKSCSFEGTGNAALIRSWRQSTDDPTVRDNSFIGNQLRTGSRGIQLIRVTNTLVRDNVATTVAWLVTTESAATNASIIGNIGHNVTTTGVQLNAARAIVSGNMIRSVTGGATSGILVGTGANDVTVMGNDIQGTFTQTIDVLSGAARVSVIGNIINVSAGQFRVQSTTTYIAGNRLEGGTTSFDAATVGESNGTLLLAGGTVTFGANDSGGSGFRLLRVPNV